MVKRLTLSCLMAAAALALWMGTGCGSSTELTGAPIPNLPPSTRVTGYPPSSIETGFIVQLHWSGFDPDGRVVKYQWRISDNGTNGISVRDTLTIDPVTGDTLNPWHETTANDSIFMVTADLPGFPGDPTGGSYPRSFQAHTFWIRAVDDKGAVDPTPAHVSFTSTTLLPTVRLDGPANVAGQTVSAVNVVPMPTFAFSGTDPDFITGLPIKYRYLWIEARRGGVPVCSKTDYDQDLIDFADTNWTSWRRFPADVDQRRIRIEDESAVADPNRCFFLAVQVQDTAGAVSIGRGYGSEVANVKITANSPLLRISERFLGSWMAKGTTPMPFFEDIAQGQRIQFSWFASGADYFGRIESYQYGWNVADAFDPDDPNWSVQPGLSPFHMATPFGQSFASGIHVLTVKAVDNSNQVTIFRITLNVVQVPAREDQRPLLLIDDIDDGASTAWPNATGTANYDNAAFRDEFWLNLLEGPGGVSGFRSDLDVYEHPYTPELSYRRAVQYRALVWINQGTGVSYVRQSFRPSFDSSEGDDDQFVWPAPYMRVAGNVLCAGNMAMTNHLATGSHSYEMPVIFESRAGDSETGLTGSSPLRRRGFGRRTDEGTGDSFWVGPTRFPFLALGISVLDIMTSDTYLYYNSIRPNLYLNRNRRARCVTMKGVTVDPEFKAAYATGGFFPDQILLEPRIDWKDQGLDSDDVLRREIETYQWSSDEFYNADIGGRPDQYSVQEGAAWDCDGPCVEPMFRSIARFDWIRAMYRASDPDTDWPDGYFTLGQLEGQGYCGPNALIVDADGVPRGAITNDRIVGFISHKTIHNKPLPVGDVVFGFDPYRLNNEHMSKVIQWVLGEHFGLQMTVGDDKHRR